MVRIDIHTNNNLSVMTELIHLSYINLEHNIIYKQKTMNYKSKFKPEKEYKSRREKEQKLNQKSNNSKVNQYQEYHREIIDPNSKGSISYFKKQSNSVSASKKNPKYSPRKDEKVKKFDKMHGLLGNIMDKHRQMKEKIEHLKRQKQSKQNSQNQQFTFQPKLNHNPRYAVPNCMQIRQKSWDQARAKHYTSIKQDLVEREVKQCTFSPRFVSALTSRKYLKEKEDRTSNNRENQREQDDPSFIGKFIQIEGQRELKFNVETKKQKPKIDVRVIKSMIKTELSRMNFDL